MLESAACHLCMVVLLSSPRPFFPQGMMGAYGPPYMPMQGPHEGLLSVATMPPHAAGGLHLPPHLLQQGMPGYPGMPHQGKERCSCPRATPAQSHPVVSLLLEGFTWSTAWSTAWSALWSTPSSHAHIPTPTGSAHTFTEAA